MNHRVGPRVQSAWRLTNFESTIEALGLRRPQTGVMRRMRQDLDALHWRKAGARPAAVLDPHVPDRVVSAL
jgi:hypothetical protein